jgi:hypothetical protein
MAYAASVTGLILSAIMLRLAVRSARQGTWLGRWAWFLLLLAGGLWAAAIELAVPVQRWCPRAIVFETPVFGAAMVGVLVGLCLTAPRSWLRRPVWIVCPVGFAYAALCITGPALTEANAFGLSTERGLEPVSQTSGWSCGAAATATMLRSLGAPLSEYEAACLCGTAPWVGTGNTGMMCALAIAGQVPSRRLVARYRDLVAAPKPCITVTRVYGSVVHAVAIAEATDVSVRMLDPLTGEQDLAREDFLRDWLRTVIWAQDPSTRPGNTLSGREPGDAP